MLLTVLLLVDSPTQPININLYFCSTAEVETLECIQKIIFIIINIHTYLLLFFGWGETKSTS